MTNFPALRVPAPGAGLSTAGTRHHCPGRLTGGPAAATWQMRSRSFTGCATVFANPTCRRLARRLSRQRHAGGGRRLVRNKALVLAALLPGGGHSGTGGLRRRAQPPLDRAPARGHADRCVLFSRLYLAFPRGSLGQGHTGIQHRTVRNSACARWISTAARTACTTRSTWRVTATWST